MKNLIKKSIGLLLGFFLLMPSFSYAVKPTTTGCTVLVIYDSGDANGAAVATGNAGFINMLKSAGAWGAFNPYAGMGFNFTVDAVDVGAAWNVGAGVDYANGSGVETKVTGAGFSPITPQNYCEVFDLRFITCNSAACYPAGTQIAADTITAADVTTYTNYVQGGGGLFIEGDNYYDFGAGTADGFRSREANMYQLINSMAVIPAVQDDFQVGGAAAAPNDIADITVTNPYNINNIDNAIGGLTYATAYPGPMVTNPSSGTPFAVGTSASTGYSGPDNLALIWGSAGELNAGFAGKMIYWGDESVLNYFANNTTPPGAPAPPAGQLNNVAEILGNVVSVLDGGTCCGATNTATASSTSTSTQTSTQTATNTSTVVDTYTETSTATETSTDTVTNTPTPSSTETVTNTATYTATNTSTQTPTSSATGTSTNTATNTSTPTIVSTYTSTSTMTVTNTATNSATNTATNTVTSTATGTNTQTVTPTPVSFVAMGKTASETVAKAGDTITYTLAVTITGPTTLSNVVITDTLPQYDNFASFGTPPTGAVTSYNAATDQLQWTFASIAPGTYNLTYQTHLSTLIQGSPVLINNAQLTGAGAPITATAPVTLTGQFTVSVNIYNSAGEIVKTIQVQQFSQPINNITLSTSNLITTLQGTGSTIDILYQGVIIGVWDGTNNSNNPVSNGNYRITVDSVGSSGVVTNVSQNATVNRNLVNVEADIYNSAGEVVRQLYNVVSDSNGTVMNNVVLSAGVISPGNSNNSNASSVSIYVNNTSSPVTLVWDGTNDSASYVTPGEYQIHIHWTNGNSNTTDITRSILVVATNGASGSVLAEPNEIKGSVTSTIFNAFGVSGAASLKVSIYTIAGELVQALTSPAPAVGWTPSGLASGIYICSVEVDNANGGLVSRQMVKVLILH